MLAFGVTWADVELAWVSSFVRVFLSGGVYIAACVRFEIRPCCWPGVGGRGAVLGGKFGVIRCVGRRESFRLCAAWMCPFLLAWRPRTCVWTVWRGRCSVECWASFKFPPSSGMQLVLFFGAAAVRVGLDWVAALERFLVLGGVLFLSCVRRAANFRG